VAIFSAAGATGLPQNCEVTYFDRAAKLETDADPG
jgi:hypothetical protein